MQSILNKLIKNRNTLLLVLIISLAVILRFYRFTEVPVSIYWDEAAIGYSAYSISETGKDEYGNTLPLLFRSFDDYKSSGYIYLTAIFVKIFGLNEFSVRFGSALFGSISVLVAFFLIKEFMKIEFSKNTHNINISSIWSIEKYKFHIPYITTLLFAISTWHIQFSRTGFEANAAHTILLIGLFYFFKFINTNNKFLLLLSAFLIGLSIYFYRSIIIFAPIFITGLGFIYFRSLINKKNISISISSIILFILLSIPIIKIIQTPEGSIRANQVSIAIEFKDKEFENAKIINSPGSNLLTRAIYNRRMTPAHVFIEKYVKYFDPRYLFQNGDGNQRHGISGYGVLYIWTAPFVLIGLLQLFKLQSKIKYTVIIWILAAAVPAAMSLPSPHNLRSLNILPMYEFIIALGIIFTLKVLPKKLNYLGSVSIFLIGFISLTVYLNKYYGEYAKTSSLDWADGYKQLAAYIIPREDEYKKIIISGHYWKPYIYMLFYKNYPPQKFQNNGSQYAFDKYIFGGTKWVKGEKELGDADLRVMAKNEHYLVALSPIEFESQEPDVRIIHEIKNHNGDIVFYLGENK